MSETPKGNQPHHATDINLEQSGEGTGIPLTQDSQIVYMMPQPEAEEIEIDLWKFVLYGIKYKIYFAIFISIGLIFSVLGPILYINLSSSSQTNKNDFIANQLDINQEQNASNAPGFFDKVFTSKGQSLIKETFQNRIIYSYEDPFIVPVSSTESIQLKNEDLFIPSRDFFQTDELKVLHPLLKKYWEIPYSFNGFQISHFLRQSKSVEFQPCLICENGTTFFVTTGSPDKTMMALKDLNTYFYNRSREKLIQTQKKLLNDLLENNEIIKNNIQKELIDFEDKFYIKEQNIDYYYILRNTDKVHKVVKLGQEKNFQNVIGKEDKKVVSLQKTSMKEISELLDINYNQINKLAEEGIRLAVQKKTNYYRLHLLQNQFRMETAPTQLNQMKQLTISLSDINQKLLDKQWENDKEISLLWDKMNFLLGVLKDSIFVQLKSNRLNFSLWEDILKNARKQDMVGLVHQIKLVGFYDEIKQNSQKIIDAKILISLLEKDVLKTLQVLDIPSMESMIVREKMVTDEDEKFIIDPFQQSQDNYLWDTLNQTKLLVGSLKKAGNQSYYLNEPPDTHHALEPIDNYHNFDVILNPILHIVPYYPEYLLNSRDGFLGKSQPEPIIHQRELVIFFKPKLIFISLVIALFLSVISIIIRVWVPILLENEKFQENKGELKAALKNWQF